MTEENCPFCDPDPACIFYRGENVFGIWDAYPVSEGHAVLVTTRHVASWFNASREEHAELASAVTIAREAILAKHHPDGFNIGVNIGETAGQTVPHLHVHLIPRYSQDVQDPRGGVRHVIPSRANYLKPESSSVDNTADRVAEAGLETLQTPLSTKANSSLVTGADDPLLPYLLSHLDHAQQADLLASFILESGVAELESRLRERLDRNAHSASSSATTSASRSPTLFCASSIYNKAPMASWTSASSSRDVGVLQKLPPQGLYISRSVPKLRQGRRLRRKLEP